MNWTSSTPEPDTVGRIRCTSGVSSSTLKSVAGQTYIMIRLASNRLCSGRVACTVRIASRHPARTFSSSGSATRRPSASRSGVRSRTWPIATSRSSARLLLATARNR